MSQPLQNRNGLVEADAGVRDAHTVVELLTRGRTLATGVEVALDHHAHQALVAASDLLGENGRNLGLVLVILLAVGVAGVDHDAALDASFFKKPQGGADVLGIEVRARGAAAQDDVTGGVALRADDAREPLFRDRKKVVGVRGRADRVDSDLLVAARAILETDGHREATGQFTVHLAFGRSSSNRAPRNKIRYELRRNGVEEFGASRHAEFDDVAQEGTCDTQSLIDVEAPVEIGIVDEALPTHRRAWLFEVGPHDDQEITGEAVCFFLQLGRVLKASFRIVDGTGSDDDEQAIVFSTDNARRLGASFRGGGHLCITGRDFLHDDGGGDQGANLIDADVIGARQHCAEFIGSAGRRVNQRKRLIDEKERRGDYFVRSLFADRRSERL